MSIGTATAIPVLLAALGAARGAEVDVDDIGGIDDRRTLFPEVHRPGVRFSGVQFPEDRRDPFEFCSPQELAPPPPPPTAGAAEFARRAEEQLVLGELGGADLLVDRALEELIARGSGDMEIMVRLRGLREKIRDTRTGADAVKEFRKLDLRLSGVAWNKSNPVALVNGELCVVGDVVEGAMIDSILPGEVVFEFSGVRIRKSLLRPGVERVEGTRATGESGERE